MTAPGADSGSESTASASLRTRHVGPILAALLSGTAWLALQAFLQIVLSLWSLRLIVDAIGPDRAGAYRFAWGLGFLQVVFEFGAGSALVWRLSDAWTRGDRAAVDRIIAGGMCFQIALAFLQALALLGVASLALPLADFGEEERQLVAQLLWLQGIAAPCFGLALVVSAVLQAARRYAFVARFEVVITVLRFVILVVGVRWDFDFFGVVVAQTMVILVLRVGPGLWVMVRELGHVPHFRGAAWDDYKALGTFSLALLLMQISMVLAEKMDTTILGFVLPAPGVPLAVYDVVSKPFLQLRQTGATLALLVTPAVAALAAARDQRGVERIAYDGTRLHVGMLLPIGLLAWIHAAAFLSLWFGDRLGSDAAQFAPLMRLFLVATIPTALAVPAQIAVGFNRIKVLALSSLAGLLVNLPLSCYLTRRLGVAGVIWGTVLTTLVANLMVPGVYLGRVLKIDPRAYLARGLGAPLGGATALIVFSLMLRSMLPSPGPEASFGIRATSLITHLGVGVLAYLVGYTRVRYGRSDVAWLVGKLRGR